MRNQNPVFANIETGTTHFEDVDAASYKGIAIKTGILLLVTALVAVLVALTLPNLNNVNSLYISLMIAMFVGFFAAMIGRMSTRAAKYCSVIYSVCQGLLIGTISAICEVFFPGIGTIAAFSTVLIFGVMLLLYATGVFRQGSLFRKLAYALSIGALVLVLFVSLFSIFIDFGSMNIGILIGIEAFLLIYGAFTLIFNFDEANMIVEAGCTKQTEWSVSLGLIVSLVYIYLQILYLLLIIFANSDRN